MEIIKMFKSKKNLWVIAAIAVVLLAGGGFAYYKLGVEPAALKAQETDETPQTAVIRRGSLEISASGSGTLVAASEKDLSFSVSGTVGAVYVTVGDQVKEGDMLAQLTDLEQLQADVASSRVDLLMAQKDLQDLYDNTDMALADAYAAYVEAKNTYEDAEIAVKRKDYARCSQDMNTMYLEEYQKWIDKVEDIEERYPDSDALIDAKNELATAQANYEYCIGYTDQEILESEADYEVAKANFNITQSELEALQAVEGVNPDDLALAKAQVTSAELDLKIAEATLDGATLEAPFDGTIVSINGDIGEEVDTSTFITIADLSRLFVEINLDETDMDMIAVGYEVSVVFDALPEKIFNGTVVQVDPVVVSSGQYDTIQGLVELDSSVLEVGQKLPLGLSATVDVIAGKIDNALLVPVEALQEQTDDSYTVYVMNGQTPEAREVEIGLKDYTYAEVISGLTQGDVVVTGNVEIN